MKTTADVKIPNDLFNKIIGQKNAVLKAKIAIKQRRNLLLLGPPGTGKSLIARAMASILEPPEQEIIITDNVEQPEKPLISIRKSVKLNNPDWLEKIKPQNAPYYVTERLGYRCKRCARLSEPSVNVCPYCHADKNSSLIPKKQKTLVEVKHEDGLKIYTNKNNVLYVFDKKYLDDYNKLYNNYKVLLPLKRNSFVQVAGASETELLGDVEHDPYGNKTKPYKRVIPGAVHQAHQGVLFIDEISTLGDLQKHLLTAMQEKKYPIVGRNPTSSGASVKVDNVPSDFILVAAANMENLSQLMPALRSRIKGNGYEVVMNTVMKDDESNKQKMLQFIAQEINKDGKIPHMDMGAVEEVLRFSRKIAQLEDKNGYTLRLRAVAGLIRAAGDLAVMNDAKVISAEHVKNAIANGLSADDQLEGNWYSVIKEDYIY